MMKRPSLILFYSLWLMSFVACQASEPVVLSVEVIEPAAAAKKLNIDNVYRKIQLVGKQYYAGFRIDSNGINHAVLIEVDAEGRQQHRWNFEDIISDIFIYKGLVSVLLDSGQNFSLVNNIWVENRQAMPQNGRVVFSDGLYHLIVCSPSPLFKDSNHVAGCESYNPRWKVSFAWHDYEPRVCGGYLYAVTWEQKYNQRLAINLNSGEVVDKTLFTGEDICTPFD